MSLVLQSSGGGSVSIVEPTTASNFTATLPAATGQLMVSGNMPAFSAYQSSAQTVNSGVWTKVQFQTEEFDTNNNYDATTNYRFTPTVAGYYQINTYVQVNGGSVNPTMAIYKNGSIFKSNYPGYTVGSPTTSISTLIYLNGSTDYIEVYINIGSTLALVASATTTYFQASMVRAA
jgi:hypothetical protein